MLKQKLITFFIFLSLGVFAQTESGRYVHKGLLRATATISPGVLLEEKTNTISLHGNFDVYIDSDLSLRSDGYFFLNTLDDIQPLAFNHSLFSGAAYHFKTNNHIDPYIAFQPGLAIAKSNGPFIITSSGEKDRITYNTAFNPLLSGVIGFNYYASKFFHLFMEVRFVEGNQLSNAPVSTSLNEVKFSFGLGFNLN